MDHHPNLPEDNEPDPLEEFLKGMLGPEGAREAARAMRAQGFDLSQVPGMDNPQAISMAMNQFKFLMHSSEGPVNWRMVEELSRQQVYQSGDPNLTAPEVGNVTRALSAADLWLDPVTTFVAAGATREAWTRMRWMEKTLPAWKEISDPVARNASEAMGDALQTELGDPEGLPEELAGLSASLSTMLPKLASMAFAAQIGQALSAMAEESLGGHDAGFPLIEGPTSALVPRNIATFGEGLQIPEEEILQYLAVRECAHVRLFASVPWLRHNLHVALLQYARHIAIDPEAIADAARSIDPADPDSITSAMENGVFATDASPEQSVALETLERLLALIEGWVEVVTTEATRPYLPHSTALREMIRRRRVTGSPAEMLLSRLVGLELRPRQTRGASHIFDALLKEEGPSGRDAIWAHPDRLPTSHDLSDPELFFAPAPSTEDSQFEAQMEALLSGTLGWDEGVPDDLRGQEATDDAPDEENSED